MFIFLGLCLPSFLLVVLGLREKQKQKTKQERIEYCKLIFNNKRRRRKLHSFSLCFVLFFFLRKRFISWCAFNTIPAYFLFYFLWKKLLCFFFFWKIMKKNKNKIYVWKILWKNNNNNKCKVKLWYIFFFKAIKTKFYYAKNWNFLFHQLISMTKAKKILIRTLDEKRKRFHFNSIIL